MNLWNSFLIACLGSFIFLSCNSGDGSRDDRLKADSLAKQVVLGKLSIETLAQSDEFMYFNDKYFYEPADLKSMSMLDKVQIQIVTYRIYQHVKLLDNRYQFTVKYAKDLHIPNKAFVYYQRSFEAMNRKAAASNDSIQLQLPDDYATKLIKE